MKPESAVFETSVGLKSQLPADTLPEIVFSGRSNVGKSTLINTLLRRKNLARTSATPGKTATINFYKLDTMRFVDLPGYGYAKVAKDEKRKWGELIEGYFAEERDLRLVIQLCDMRHDPTADDRQMIEFMAENGLPFLVVLTKADKLNKTERAARLAAYEAIFAEFEGLTVIPYSSVTGEGREDLLAIIREVGEDD
ncbi:MAG: ribosome biogenesis GTP-binding protein YihA/YsxC [Clostridia bacterium]|nr:ribosome biogenesis GTP-binding protein YihA/YsxC [Clostridia bacterium]